MASFRTRFLAVALGCGMAIAASCGGSTETDSSEASGAAATDSGDAMEQPTSDETVGVTGIRMVTPAAGAELQTDPPEGLVILDVRTPEEFAQGHLDGAIQIDFYAEDFAARLAELDPDVPYLLYCRSGSRSGQTTAILNELDFVDVADIDGGIVAWADAGLPIVTG